jgi:hypothetical protein
MGRGGEAQASGSPPEVRRDPTRGTHDSSSRTRVAYPPFRDTTVARPSSPRTSDPGPRTRITYPAREFPQPVYRNPLSPPSHPILPNQHSGTSSSWVPASRAPPSPTPSATRAATSSSSSEISPNPSASSANFYNPAATSSSKNSAWSTAWTRSTRRRCTATPCTRTAARRSWGTRSRGAATT